jgi:hypothetical protein
MTVETATNEARDVALGQVEELEKLNDTPDTIADWLSESVYDIRATYSLSPKSLVEVEAMTAGGGPTVWVSYNGNESGTMTVKASWGADKWETHATAPSVADYLWEIVEAYE